MQIHKLRQTTYTELLHVSLHWQAWAQENTVYSAFSKSISCWAMDIVVKTNTTSPIWRMHPYAFVQVCSCSHDRTRLAGQGICEPFAKLAKYKQDGCKWKMLTRNVATCPAIPIPQRALADKELTCPLAWWRSNEPCRLHRTWQLSHWFATQQVESVYRTFEPCVSMS